MQREVNFIKAGFRHADDGITVVEYPKKDGVLVSERCAELAIALGFAEDPLAGRFRLGDAAIDPASVPPGAGGEAPGELTIQTIDIDVDFGTPGESIMPKDHPALAQIGDLVLTTVESEVPETFELRADQTNPDPALSDGLMQKGDTVLTQDSVFQIPASDAAAIGAMLLEDSAVADEQKRLAEGEDTQIEADDTQIGDGLPLDAPGGSQTGEAKSSRSSRRGRRSTASKSPPSADGAASS